MARGDGPARSDLTQARDGALLNREGGAIAAVVIDLFLRGLDRLVAIRRAQARPAPHHLRRRARSTRGLRSISAGQCSVEGVELARAVYRSDILIPAALPATRNDTPVGTAAMPTVGDLTPHADRWLNVLWLFEAEIRALHRQLVADREQAETTRKASDQPAHSTTAS